MSNQDHNYQRTVFVLLAHGFAEQETITCVENLRRMRVPVTLVGVTNGLVTGQYGLKIKPDCSLEDVRIGTLPQMLIIPNGIELYLATDPRIHRLVNNILDNQGFVAAMSTAEPFLYQYSGDKVRQFHLQGGMETAVFLDQLVDIAVSVDQNQLSKGI